MLDKIVKLKQEEVRQRKQSQPLSSLEERITRQPAPLDFATAIKGEPIRLIAEVKRASPSRGTLCPDFDPIKLAREYAQGGASAISVLTEVNHFGGRLEYLAAIRKETTLPLLRKDFIFDPYQVYESRAYGADALLLITAILSQEQLDELLSLSHQLGLDCLVEVHNEAELDRAISSGAQIIGINNRDLATFTIDLDTTRRLRSLVPAQKTVVSESGIKNRRDVEQLMEWGVDALLIGEALVTVPDIQAKIRELMP
jgi:indole-3-glycerol phosphate synthase